MIMGQNEERSCYSMGLNFEFRIGTAAREAWGEAWNLGQNVAFGPGQSKATKGLDRVSLKNEMCKYDVTKMHRKKTYLLTAERRLAELFTKGRARDI